MIVGITMQQPAREAASPHGAGRRGHDSSGDAAAATVETGKAAANHATDPALYDAPPPHDPLLGLPPQQVYVSNNNNAGGAGLGNMAALQSQFQALGFQPPQPEEASSTEPSSSQSNTHNAEEDQDAEDGEDEPVKLFVGQVPKTLNEEDIFPVFDAYGPLKDVAIIRDKHSGLHRGCAFVTYWNLPDAQAAQEALHDAYTFPGARRPAQVKPAEPSVTTVPENKLFIGMLPRKAGEEELRSLFEPFGEIEEIHLIRSADGTSKGAAFLRYISRESAVAAIESLNNQMPLEESAKPLIVRFADSKHQRHQRQLRTVRRHEMMMPPGAYSPYHPQMVHPSMGMHPGAQGAYPMVPQHYAAAAVAAVGYPPNAAGHPYLYPPHHHPQYGQVAAGPYGYPGQPRPDLRSQAARPREGPPGANLFVYHLPHDLTDADLATAFNPFGTVVSAKVYVDKYTGESKGFGFVSYDSVDSANTAIEQMNGFQIGNKRLKVQHKRIHGEAAAVAP